MIVVKLGGSLIHRAQELVREINDYSITEGKQILIVPGGSVFADTVRKVDASQEAAHWMAVLAMEQYGYYLADGTDVRLVHGLDNTGEGARILLPYTFLKQNDELPHSWDVTSDTIAAWVALKLNARLIKATDVDGIYIDGELYNELSAVSLIGKDTCVDAQLPGFLVENKMDCEIVNGNCPGRLVSSFREKVIKTIIKG